MKLTTTLKTLLACMLAILASLLSAQALTANDVEFDQALQGAWCQSEDGGKTCDAFDFIDSGKLRGCGKIPVFNVVVNVEATYTIKDGVMCQVIVDTNMKRFIDIGSKICLQTQSFDAKKWVYKDLESGDITVAYKTPKESAICPK